MVGRTKSRGWSDRLAMGALGSCRSAGRRWPGSDCCGRASRIASLVRPSIWLGSRGGTNTIEFLVGRNKLERISTDDLGPATAVLVQRATKRLETAKGALAAEDFDGAFTNAYDVYRMAGEALLLVQGLRATGGDGSHVTVEDAVCAQFGGVVEDFNKAIYECFRQGRHAAQYFHPSKAEKTRPDAGWALSTADRALSRSTALIDGGTVEPY